MITRFSLYSVCKNLRFFEHFFVLYLIAPAAAGGAGLTFFQMGLLTGYQKLLTALLEVPSGYFADRHGRLTAVQVTFASYAVAFPLYAMAAVSGDAWRLVLLGAAQTLFGVGEAFRTGTHKAVQLDWVDRERPEGGATRVIGVTRFWSKLASGVSALAGGVLLWTTGTFTWLFLLATVPAVAGGLLMRTYPRWLQGEARRGESVRGPGLKGFRSQWLAMWAAPGIVLLVAVSVLYETSLKLVQQYVQPFLGFGFNDLGLEVVGGVGGMLIGTYYLVEGLLAALASRGASGVADRLGRRALESIHAITAGIAVLVAATLVPGGFAVPLIGFLLLIAMQNARRPVFLDRLNRRMDKPQRAATLSIESQVRSLLFAAVAPGVGWVADGHGLPGAVAVLAGGLVLAAALGLRARDDAPTEGGAGS